MSATHAEKDAIIKELRDKLKEMKGVEKQVTASADNLTAPGVGLHKDQAGNFFLVELKFDAESKAGTVANLVSLDSKDPSIASFKLKEYVIENVFRKITGGKYHV